MHIRLRDETWAEARTAIEEGTKGAKWPLWLLIDDAVEVMDMAAANRSALERGIFVLHDSTLVHNQDELLETLRHGWWA